MNDMSASDLGFGQKRTHLIAREMVFQLFSLVDVGRLFCLPHLV